MNDYRLIVVITVTTNYEFFFVTYAVKKPQSLFYNAAEKSVILTNLN